MEDKMINEQLRKMAKEAMDDALKRMASARDAEPDPDPETERMIAEKEAEDKRTPDDLLSDAMKSACRLLEEAAFEAGRSLLSPGRMSDLLRSASELLRTISYLHDRISAQKTTEKLRFMRSVEQKNDENIRKWSDEHEQGDSGPRGDQSEG